jgi:hypothetical protein
MPHHGFSFLKVAASRALPRLNYLTIKIPARNPENPNFYGRSGGEGLLGCFPDLGNLSLVPGTEIA